MQDDNLNLKIRRKVVIFLIHNNDQERLSYIRPRIDALKSELQKIIDVSIVEISHQPELKPVSLRVGLMRDLMYWKLGREWSTYRKNKNQLIAFSFLSMIIAISKKYFSGKDVVERWVRSCAIEMYVADKHLRAFSIALEHHADYAICFEDDAVFMDESVDNVLRLIGRLENRSNENSIYIDLAGGCSLNDLNISKLEFKRDNNFIYYSRPVTNTACCYLVNRRQLENFVYFLTRHPLLRYIGIDWCMNMLFMLQFKQGLASDCFHAYPHFFKHGSATGEHQPWAR